MLTAARLRENNLPGCGEAQNTLLPGEERNPYLIAVDKNTVKIPFPVINSQPSSVNHGVAIDQDRQLAKLETIIHDGNTCK